MRWHFATGGAHHGAMTALARAIVGNSAEETGQGARLKAVGGHFGPETRVNIQCTAAVLSRHGDSTGRCVR
jgi:hypothetical protein